MTPEQEAREERSCIAEYDGKLTRAEADALAERLHPLSWWERQQREGFTASAQARVVDTTTPSARKVRGDRVVGSGRAVIGGKR